MESVAIRVDMNGVEVSETPNARLVYKLPVKVAVEFAKSDGVLETKEGPVPYAQGSALVTGTEGERWPISRQKFEATYESAEGQAMGNDGKYSKKRIDVWAVQVGRPFTVRTSRRVPLQGRSDDWLVQYGKNDYGIVAQEIFAKTYAEAK